MFVFFAYIVIKSGSINIKQDQTMIADAFWHIVIYIISSAKNANILVFGCQSVCRVLFVHSCP